ncbi:helix-turn-helix transcriptional regulator [Amycolatopsis sp. WAC 04182]|uniref:helix-turn-helix transcriptional regulator n=1 Tax=Amycolatopsis sp. WAC 04182 TaxID=2203198 RepID=UPI000F7B76F2|nr:LuxR family transcriptional regulator [Amycolatopsis sp. WAC 04182]RSN60575.1 helix-turn-helix transcriptional regulator [Amycolatopsis sp. WAC 04182]
MLCGREAESRQIDSVLDGARRGDSGVLLFYGEAGIGKTALLEYGEAAAGDMRVLQVRGFEPEQNLAFSGLSQIFFPLTCEIAELPEAQARALCGALAMGPPVAADRFAVYAATLGLLAQLAEYRPLLVTIDDLQWLDGPSAEALTFAAHRLVAENIAILAAVRHSRAQIGADWQLPTCVLEGLGDDDTARLIEAHTAIRPASAVVNHLRRETAGNPMALLETLNGLTAAHLTGGAQLPAVVPVDAAGALFAPRVAALDERARDALTLLAVSRSSRMGTVLAAGQNLSLPAQAFLDVEASGLVEFGNGSFRFTHPLARTAATTAVPPARRRRAHLALAEAAGEPEQMPERVWHLAEAALGPDEQVALALERVAERTRSRNGYASAVSALVRAAALSQTEVARARRLFAAAENALLAGQSTRARSLLMQADALTDDLDLRGAVAANRGRVELFTGHPALARRVVGAAADTFRVTDPKRCAELLADSAVAALLAGDAIAAVEAADAANRVAPRGSTSTAFIIKVVQGMTLLHMRDLVRGSALLHEAAAMVEHWGDESLRVEYVILSSLGMYWIGMHDLALRVLSSVVNRLRDTGAIGMLPFALATSAYCEARAGRVNSARSIASEAVELSLLGGHSLWRYLALSSLAHVEAIRGDEDDCRAHVARALTLRARNADYPRDAAEALALLELGKGRYDEAIKSTGDTGPEVGHPDLIEARIRNGSPPDDAPIDALATNTTLPLQAAVAWRLKGLLADNAEFVECFTTAIGLHSQVLCPFEEARTLLAYGERLRRAGHRVQSREHLRPALEIFTALPAAQWAARTRQELAATGEIRRDTTRVSGLEQLTPQEYQVARAVVTGATNRDIASLLFLSTKTIEYHLNNVFRKLGLRRRTELGHRFPELLAGS